MIAVAVGVGVTESNMMKRRLGWEKTDQGGRGILFLGVGQGNWLRDLLQQLVITIVKLGKNQKRKTTEREIGCSETGNGT